MILLFSDEKLTNDSPRIVNILLGLYKKNPALPRFVITQAISNFLSVVTRSALQSSLEPLLHSLHIMVSTMKTRRGVFAVWSMLIGIVRRCA